MSSAKQHGVVSDEAIRDLLLREDGAVLSREQSGYDAKGHLLGTSYSDGTSLSNIWDCCRLQASVARDGARTEYDAVPGDDHWSRVSEASLGGLPGADGRFPAVETFTDALGRETNSVRAVMSNGSRDAAYAPLATRTEYPYGTDGYSVTTDPLGVRTVSCTYYADNAKITETSSAGVTNRTTETRGWGSYRDIETNARPGMEPECGVIGVEADVNRGFCSGMSNPSIA